MINKITKLIATGIDLYRGSAAYPASATMKYAQATLLSDATAPSDGDTVLIGAATYRFKTSLVAAYDVLIGISASVALDNLKSAINGTAGAGTTYGTGTAAHPLVQATTKTATTLLLIARTPGIGGNAITVSETSSHLSVGSTTLTQMEVDPSDLGSLAGSGINQVEFHLVNVSDTSATLTLSPEELMEFPDNSVPQAELIGWVPVMECLAPATSKAQVLVERTFTGAAAYSFSVPKTIADRVHLRIKADKAVTADLYQSAALNQG